MGKGPANGGEVASRGFIFQTIVAEIQCLERNDWDAIKVEPKTENDKVDLMLYRDGKIKAAIQVKSSINPFLERKVKVWYENLREDAAGAEEICLYLVNDPVTSLSEEFISENGNEIKIVPFKNIQKICIETLIKYIRGKGVDWDVRMEDYEFISDALFSKLFKNSISEKPVSRREFEERFEKALPVHVIPLCLTPIPATNQVVGLVGRSEIKKTVRSMLEKNGSMAIVNGLGGIGKTAVMQHICNDLRDERKYVAWVECGGSLKEDLLLLRTALGIPESDNADTAYAKILNEIKSNRRFSENLYLFLDNISRFLSKEEQGVLKGLNIHVMATSRFRHEYFMNLPLDVLAEGSALDMFYGYYLERQTDKTRRYVDSAKEIIKSVQSHTLLVELLAKAASKKGGTLEDFYSDLKKQGIFDVFKRKLNTDHDRNRTIEECVMELYRISDLTSSQRHIMRLFTIFTPEKEIYYRIGEWANLDMDALDGLVELGWLEQGGLENGYHIHQIIRDSVAKQVEKDKENVKLEEYGDLLDKVFDTKSYLGKEVIYEKVRERIVLTEDVARFISDSGREDAAAGALLNNMAGVYKYQGDYDRALEYYWKALEISGRILGTGHPDTAVTYNNMALVFHAQGDYDRALEYYGKALAINERFLGMGHPDTAVTYNNVAGVFCAQGNYNKALENYGKALAINERFLGMVHPNTAATYNNIAGVYYVQRDFNKALEYYGKALKIVERVLGTDHPDTATTYNNMASVYEDQGDYDKALEYFGKALEISERVLGPDHPDTAMTYNNMGDMFREQGDYGKALEYYRKALKIRERVFGTGHSYTAGTYNNMALVFQAKGNYDKALEFLGKALEIRERVFGTGHPDTAMTYSNMAGIFYDQGDYSKALENYGKALKIRECVLGTGHPDTAVTYNNMAVVYEDQGDYDKALENYGKALRIRECIFGKGHPSTATTYNDMAGVLRLQCDYSRALEYYGKALEIYERVLGTSHLDTAATYSNMALMFYEQKDYDKALEYFGKALKIKERVLGMGHPDNAVTYNNMGRVFHMQGDYDKALEYYGKALEIRERVLGMGHPSTAATYNNLAGVSHDQGDYDRALEYYGKALEIYERVLGTSHLDTAVTYSNMALMFYEQKDYDKALEYFGKALKIKERVLGTGHPSTATTYNNMALVFHAQGYYNKALEFYKKANIIFLSVFGEKHPHTQSTQQGIMKMKKLLK